MLNEYLNAALATAKYEIIEDTEPYYGEIPDLKGVWATGTSFEDCKQKLLSVLEEWIILRILFGKNIPTINGLTITIPVENKVIA